MGLFATFLEEYAGQTRWPYQRDVRSSAFERHANRGIKLPIPNSDNGTKRRP